MKRLALAALIVGAVAFPAAAQVPVNTGKLVSTDAEGGVAGFQVCAGAPSGGTRCSIVRAMVGIGGSNIVTGQVSATTTATLVAAARTGRQKIIVSVGAANGCVVGNATVTAATGFPLPVANQSISMDTNAAIYAVCTAATTVSFVELY